MVLFFCMSEQEADSFPFAKQILCLPDFFPHVHRDQGLCETDSGQTDIHSFTERFVRS